jgi:hypothetical protein
MDPKKFFGELKRRNVYRAAVAYGVVAWFLTQVTTQVFPFFEIPNSAIRFVVIALVVGFPIVMCLSWLYELTPQGIIRSDNLDPAKAQSSRRATGRILDFIIIGVLLLVIAMLIYGRHPLRTFAGESIPEKSIAVFPFENRSENKENTFFADGMQDEILTDLARIADLKVISRTSVMQYRTGVVRNLREIRQQLSVRTSSKEVFSARAIAYGSTRSYSMPGQTHISGRRLTIAISRTCSQFRAKLPKPSQPNFRLSFRRTRRRRSSDHPLPI